MRRKAASQSQSKILVEEDEAAKASQESKGKIKQVSSLDALLRVCKALMEGVSQQLDKSFDIILNGAETREIEEVAKANWEYDQVISLCLCRQENHTGAHSTMSLF